MESRGDCGYGSRCSWISLAELAHLERADIVSLSSTPMKSVFKSGMRAGDWFCGQCGAQNYSQRYDCYRCAMIKPGFGSVPGWSEFFVERMKELESQRSALQTQLQSVENNVREVQRGQTLLESVSMQSPVPSSVATTKSNYVYTPHAVTVASPGSSTDSADVLSQLKELRAEVESLRGKSKTELPARKVVKRRSESPVSLPRRAVSPLRSVVFAPPAPTSGRGPPSRPAPVPSKRSRSDRSDKSDTRDVCTELPVDGSFKDVVLTAARVPKRPLDLRRRTIEDLSRDGQSLVRPDRLRSCSEEERRCRRSDRDRGGRSPQKKVPRRF